MQYHVVRPGTYAALRAAYTATTPKIAVSTVIVHRSIIKFVAKAQ